MARKKPVKIEQSIPKDFSPQEIKYGINKLRKRLEDIEKLRLDNVKYDDQRVNNVEFNIRETIREVFGPQSPEFNRYQYYDIWDGPHIMGVGGPHPGNQGYFEAGIPQAITMFEGLIARLEEKRQDFNFDSSTQAKSLFQGLDMHPRILSVAKDLYLDGHYSNAVFDSAKALINYVKEKSGKYDLDGAPLMRSVFSKNNPIVAFNDGVDQTSKDEQEGLMHLFEGVVLAIRNPRGHAFFDDDPQKALEYIVMISHLTKRLDTAKRLKR